MEDVIETLLELASNEVPVNYNSLINTFNNDKFEISYSNKEYAKRHINRNNIYTLYHIIEMPNLMKRLKQKMILE